jgi:hypothetical protein
MRTESTTEKCGRCGTRYDPRGRGRDCPHTSTEPEPAYFARIRAAGRPYKLEPIAAAEDAAEAGTIGPMYGEAAAQ